VRMPIRVIGALVMALNLVIWLSRYPNDPINDQITR
jgi:hypothetical protein